MNLEDFVLENFQLRKFCWLTTLGEAKNLHRYLGEDFAITLVKYFWHYDHNVQPGGVLRSLLRGPMTVICNLWDNCETCYA